MPKEARVYLKDNHFYTAIWVNGKYDRKSTKYRCDRPFDKKNPDWWKGSKHEAAIQNIIDIRMANRTAFRNGSSDIIKEPTTSNSPTWELLLSKYAQEYYDLNDCKLEKGTLQKYVTAIAALRRFDATANIYTFDLSDAKRFKEWLKEQYELETAYSYVRRLKTLAKIAQELGYIESNVFAAIKIHFEPKKKLPMPIDEEKRLLAVAFKYDREAFYEAFVMRLTGYRFSDMKLIEAEFFIGDLIDGRNKKMKRFEPYPNHKALAAVIQDMGITSGRLFPWDYTQQLNDPLKELCKIAGVRQFTSSTFKDNYGNELDAVVTEDRIYARLMHHKKKTGSASMASERYVFHVERMRYWLDMRFPHWLEFYNRLKSDLKGECKRLGLKLDPKYIYQRPWKHSQIHGIKPNKRK